MSVSDKDTTDDVDTGETRDTPGDSDHCLQSLMSLCRDTLLSPVILQLLLTRVQTKLKSTKVNDFH